MRDSAWCPHKVKNPSTGELDWCWKYDPQNDPWGLGPILQLYNHVLKVHRRKAAA